MHRPPHPSSARTPAGTYGAVLLCHPTSPNPSPPRSCTCLGLEAETLAGAANELHPCAGGAVVVKAGAIKALYDIPRGGVAV